MQVTERIELDVTAPIRLDEDPDGSETLLVWLRVNKVLFLATADHFQRFSEVLENDALAFTVFRQVATLRRAKGEAGFEGGHDRKKVSKAFRRLTEAKGRVW